VLITHPQGVLGLVHDAISRTAVDRVVLAAADLVAEGLASGLVRVRDDAAADIVGGVGEGLLHLLGGRFGGVGG
jgi:hypothetical protein